MPEVIAGECHCGAVSYKFNETPEFAVECNCSICRRLGVHWIYGKRETVDISAPQDGLINYIWGDKELVFHSCKTCGVTTHYTAANPEKHNAVVVNLKLADPRHAKSIPLRHFDGAESWKFLD